MKTLRLLVALVAGTVACADLEVMNDNNPSRETVVRNSQDVLALISNAMIQWYGPCCGTGAGMGNTNPGISMSAMADEFSTGFTDFGAQDLSREPREAINQGIGTLSTHEATWINFYSNIAALNAALQAISKYDLQLRNASGVDVTAEAHAYAKFMQALNHGYVALIFDRGYVFSESVDTDTLRFSPENPGVQNLIRPYGEVMDTAIAELNAALAIAQSATFTYPSGVPTQWFLGVPVTNTELQRIIHSYLARFKVYVARTPAERAAVNWNEVIQHIDQGITSDFGVMGSIGFVQSLYKHRAARLRTTIPGDFMRVDYRLVGPADQSPLTRHPDSTYVEWYRKPWADRTPFRMIVADRRIEGATPRPPTCAPTLQNIVCGKYIGYHNSTVFAANRGLGQRSFYFFHRFGSLNTFQDGFMPIMNVAEMDLLKAEGLIRLGRAEEAIPLINRYRVTNGELPPVDINGVPGTAPDCTPRRLNGDCGSLWDALMYEKRIETLGLEGGTAYYDARGWQFLVQNTPLHFPMPRRDLELLRLDTYTFGGGLEASAPAPDFERCPAGVTLPRC